MSTKNEATPRPWRLDGNRIIGTYYREPEANHLIASVSTYRGVDAPDHEANAALIVEAVNAYDSVRELVEAARDVLVAGWHRRACAMAIEMKLVQCTCGWEDIARALRAALAKVEP